MPKNVFFFYFSASNVVSPLVAITLCVCVCLCVFITFCHILFFFSLSQRFCLSHSILSYPSYYPSCYYKQTRSDNNICQSDFINPPFFFLFWWWSWRWEKKQKKTHQWERRKKWKFYGKWKFELWFYGSLEREKRFYNLFSSDFNYFPARWWKIKNWFF